jgi:hypothetical protein
MSDNLDEMLTARLELPSGEAPITMSRWHWLVLDFLVQKRHVDVVAEIAERCAEYPGESIEQVVIWYVETSFEAEQSLERDEAASDAA